ncbi:MAG: S8 family serine peptidase, partial [Acidobacteriaceae bacterium]|nr:S8 family serine peptidase [Acidobacteriaceae bacterium]
MISIKKLIYFLTALVCVLPVWGRETETYNGHQVVAKQVIFRFLGGGSASPAIGSAMQQITAFGNADDFRPLSTSLGVYVIHSKTSSVAALLSMLKGFPGVAFVEPDYIVKPVSTPNDPYFSQQWDMYNTGAPGADIGATAAWSLSTGSTANVIGVVDTGIDYNHPDLAPNVWSAPAPFTVSLSWGQLTCPAGSHGYNAITRSCDPRDDNQHGTHVSGTIGAVGNNGQGVAGVNWTASIMGLKFMDASGSGAVSDAIDAIEFALQAKTTFGAAANVRVLSNSWGGSDYSQALVNEINKAGGADVLFVVAAGNSSGNNDVTPTYPASYNTANMIAVAATSNNDTLASFSNYGPSTVHLGAPGVSILSTLPNNSYGFLSGTSMATPHVAGAALLVLSQCGLSTASLKNTLLSTVDHIPSLQGVTTSGGRLNVNNALRSCAGPPANGAATFIKADTTTSGSWKGVYGGDGYQVINDSAVIPSYVSTGISGNSAFTWAASTADPRGLLKGSSTTDRIASCWYTPTSLALSLNFNDSNPHQVALYMVDWDSWGGGRAERVDVLDGNGHVLDSRPLSNFTNGVYLVWNLSGHVVLQITNTNPASNGLVSGIFFGPGAGGGGGNNNNTGSAAFLKSDTSTLGSWKGLYGSDGYEVIDDSTSIPAYVNTSAAGNASYVWTPSTGDPRGLLKGASADRIGACWYSSSPFTINIAFNDTNTHQVALYMVDWDGWGGGRNQRIDILDANGKVLDTRSASNFSNGLYLVWNLSGHVVIQITNLNPASNAVVSGVFFGGGSTSAG